MKNMNWILLIAFIIFASCINKNHNESLSNDLVSVHPEKELSREDSIEISMRRIFYDLLNNKWASYKPDTIRIDHFRRTDLLQQEFLNFKYLAFRGRIDDCFIINHDNASILASKGPLLFQIHLSRHEYDKIFQQGYVTYVYFLVSNFEFIYDILIQDGNEEYNRLINCQLVDFAID